MWKKIKPRGKKKKTCVRRERGKLLTPDKVVVVRMEGRGGRRSVGQLSVHDDVRAFCGIGQRELGCRLQVIDWIGTGARLALLNVSFPELPTYSTLPTTCQCSGDFQPQPNWKIN